MTLKFLIKVFPLILYFSQPVFSSENLSTLSLQNQNINHLTLKQLIEMALNQSQLIKNMKLNLDSAIHEEKSTLSQMLPKIDFVANHVFENSNSINNTSSLNSVNDSPWNTHLSLVLSENIYDNGLSFSKHQISQMERKRIEIQFNISRDQLIYDLADKFLNYSYYKKLIKFRESHFQVLKRQFNSVEKFYLHGLKTKKDYLRAKSQVLRTEIEIDNLKSKNGDFKKELLILAGYLTENRNDDLISKIELIPLDFTEELFLKDSHVEFKLLNQNIDTFPEFQTLDLESRINELKLNLTPKNFWPEISAQGLVSYTTYQNSRSEFNDNRSNHWELGLTLKYNLLDWGYRSSERIKAENSKNITQNQINFKKIDTFNKIKSLIEDHEKMLKNVKITKELLSQELENIALIENEYRSGKISFLDFITSFNYLTDAQNQHYSNLVVLQNLRFKILNYQGKIYEALTR